MTFISTDKGDVTVPLCVCVCVSFSAVSDSLQPHGLSMEFSRQENWSWLLFPSPFCELKVNISSNKRCIQVQTFYKLIL